MKQYKFSSCPLDGQASTCWTVHKIVNISYVCFDWATNTYFGNVTSNKLATLILWRQEPSEFQNYAGIVFGLQSEPLPLYP